MKRKITIGILIVGILALLGAAGYFGYTQYQTYEKENGFEGGRYRFCEGQEFVPQTGKQDRTKFVYELSDPTVAEIDARGKVIGKKVGVTELMVKDGIFRYRCELEVREHSYVPATCEQDGYCSYCTAFSGEAALGHTPGELTCVQDSICLVCDKLLEKAPGHTFSEPTCEEDSVCTVCGEPGTKKALGHDMKEATCTLPSTCSRCGKTEGEALGHTEGEVKCEEPLTCVVCGELLAEAAPHDYAEATCTKPETCTRCGATKGKKLGHDADPATCIAEGKCKRCGKVVYKKTAHTYAEGTCTVCGAAQPVTQTTTGSNQGYVEQVVALCNAERAKYGLCPLTMEATSNAVAQLGRDECVQRFPHTSPEGTSCFTAFAAMGATYSTAGENIAGGYRTPESVVEGWMGSEGHRANILNPEFTRIGVGVTSSSDKYKIYWAQAFAG
ncbi:MAG: CAP domain-containing protein [Acetatifactor sp.]|nr:CAP domain-containing protein [Acetatifactor sp.]